jgi:3-deoxy-D-manno-octulosonate 8-phosphate phosphatase (KDO 8-P phosphatase)
MNQPTTDDHAALCHRVAGIRLLLLDVDGVLTDGSIVYLDNGTELKRFHVRDGSGIKLWRKAGHEAVIVSGRTSAATTRRARELGIERVWQGQENKQSALAEVLAMTGLTADAVCAMGDDLADIPVLRSVGLAVAVADACPEVRALADYVTPVPGGHGAVRCAIEWLLRLQGRWDELTQLYHESG